MEKILSLKVPYNYLQEIRLAHAVTESGYAVAIESSDKIKFQQLEAVFNVEFPLQKSVIPLISDIDIRHKGAAPHTQIGNLKRPLIFPHAMLDHCRDLWPDKRTIDFCFLGLVTPARKKWLSLILEKRVSGFFGIAQKLKLQVLINNLLMKLGLSSARVLITATTRGRKFPGKSWDEEYYAHMASSKFVLCPSGDAGCPWTYRFFEAMLCGAIPIVETVTPAYEPFYFLTKDDGQSDFIYSREKAQANFDLCRKLLTIPKEQMREEVERLTKSKEKSNA